MMLKPISESPLATLTISGLSSSLTLTKTVPESGNLLPAAICALAKAVPKSFDMPMTSPVDLISGPRIMSTPGNFMNGKTASLTETYGRRHLLT